MQQNNCRKKITLRHLIRKGKWEKSNVLSTHLQIAEKGQNTREKSRTEEIVTRAEMNETEHRREV